MSGPPARLRSGSLSALVGPPRGASARVRATPLLDPASIRAAPVKGVELLMGQLTAGSGRKQGSLSNCGLGQIMLCAIQGNLANRENLDLHRWPGGFHILLLYQKNTVRLKGDPTYYHCPLLLEPPAQNPQNNKTKKPGH